MKLAVEVDCLLTSVQVCLWVQKMLNEEVIIGVLYVLIGKSRLCGRALNVAYTQLYMCCVIKLVGYFKNIFIC